jgi:hypothetical protein
MAIAVSNVLEIVESSLHNGSLEAEYYLKAIAHLAMMTNIGFLDVQFFLFSKNHNAIIKSHWFALLNCVFACAGELCS